MDGKGNLNLHRLAATLCALCALLLAAGAQAQSTTASIRVEVVDETGAPIGGLPITITHLPTANSHSLVTNAQGVIVARSGTSRLLAYGLHLGARLPAHATSTGRVLLAAKSRGEFNAWMKGRVLPRLTVHTTVDPRKFRALIEDVRRQDMALASEEHELGVHALAVPLRNMNGQTVAALNQDLDDDLVFAGTIGVTYKKLPEGRFEFRPMDSTAFDAAGIAVKVAWNDGGTREVEGSSFGAPLVAGLTARLMSLKPKLTPYEVKSLLKAYADRQAAGWWEDWMTKTSADPGS